MSRHTLGPWLLCTGWVVLGCSDEKDSVPTAPIATLAVAASVVPGDPLPWVTSAERARFEQGAQQFDVEFEEETGLGPLFNEASCAECHEDPVRGGSGDEFEFHATAINSDNSCNELTELGGPVYQNLSSFALQPLLAQLKVLKEPVPLVATKLGARTSAPLFGLGLLDAIPDATILALADPSDRNGDGISGRANLTSDGSVGRFGRKAAVASLRAFNDGAFRDEMGITSAAVPTEGSFGGYEMPARADLVPDPEISDEALALADAFVRLLAPVSPLALTKDARDGRNTFARISCAGCHVPTLKTGNNPAAALRYREVAAYTDLLLHDMGPDMADICRVGASAAEFRTQPLMGLRLQTQFMHDGRASTVTAAIEAHGGEATGSRQRFAQLTEKDRAALIAFLNTL